METAMSKRTLVGSAAAALVAFVLGGCARRTEAASAETFEIVKSPEDWRRILTPEQYAVLREESTERAGSSPLDKEARAGTYACAGCDLPVYRSGAKFESGTGWPSFTAPSTVRSARPRIAVRCADRGLLPQVRRPPRARLRRRPCTHRKAYA